MRLRSTKIITPFFEKIYTLLGRFKNAALSFFESVKSFCAMMTKDEIQDFDETLMGDARVVHAIDSSKTFTPYRQGTSDATIGETSATSSDTALHHRGSPKMV